MPKDSAGLVMMNDGLMKLQYTIFMMILFIVFVLVSIVLMPLAWMVGCIDKLSSRNSNYSPTDKVMNLLFIPFGLVMLSLDLIADIVYFWTNSFRQGLKLKIIEKETSLMNH